MKITDNVYFYQGTYGGIRSWSNSVVIKGEKKILIDSGPDLKINLGDLFQAMSEDGIDISQIDEFWYTHGHPDHAGSAGILSEKFKRKIRCHYKAEGILGNPPAMEKFIISFLENAVRGRKIVRTPSRLRRIFLTISTYGRFFYWLVFKFFSFCLEKTFGKWLPALGLEIFEEDGEIIKINPDVQILFLPGHTPEEVGFWIKDQKILILGDLISVSHLWREKIPILNNPKSSFSDTLASLKRINKLPIEIMILGHGFFLRDKKSINGFLKGMIAGMEYYQKSVRELLDKKPGIKHGEISKIILSRMPGTAPIFEKKNYLEAILDSIGYYEKYK